MTMILYILIIKINIINIIKTMNNLYKKNLKSIYNRPKN